MMESLLPKKSRTFNLVQITMERKLQDNSRNSVEESILTISLKPLPPSKVSFQNYSVLNSIEKCVGQVQALSQDSHIKTLDKQQVTD